MDPLAELPQKHSIPEETCRAIRECPELPAEAAASLGELLLGMSDTGVFTAYHPLGPPTHLLPSPESALGKHFSEVFPANVSELTHDAVVALEAMGSPQGFDCCVDTGDGQCWLSIHLSRLAAEAMAERPCIVVSVREFTARGGGEPWKSESAEELEAEIRSLTEANALLRREVERCRQAEAEAFAAARFLESILESLSEGVLVTDAEDIITYANSAFAEILAVGKGHLLGERMAPHVVRQGVASLVGHYQQARRGLQAVTFEEVARADGEGTPRYLSGSMTPLTVDGVFSGMICSVDDVTRQRDSRRPRRVQGELARALLEAECLEEGLGLCLETALQLTGCDWGSIYVADESTGDLGLYVHRGLGESLGQGPGSASASDPVARLVMGGRYAYVPATEEGVGPLVVLPIMRRGRLTAGLVCGRRGPASTEVVPRRVLEMIGSQIGATVARFAAEERLRRAEERYRLAFEATHDGIWDMRPHVGEVYWSPRVWEMLGYRFSSVEEAVEHWREIVHPDDVCLLDLSEGRAVEGVGDPLDFVFRGYTPAGEERYIRARGQVVVSGDPSRGPRWVGANTDVTDQVLAERAMRQLRQAYRLTADALDDMVHVMDANYRVALANAACRRWCEEHGLPCDELEGRPLLEVFPFLGEGVLAEYRSVFETGEPHRMRREVYVGGRAIATETHRMPVAEGGRTVQVVTLVHCLDHATPMAGS